MGLDPKEKPLNDDPKELRVFHEENGVLMDILSDESELFASALEVLKNGEATVELKKRYMLRSIDEQWVTAIEDTLPYLDTAIRNPGKYIVEREEVLPIEMSKNISPASLKHLAMHTDMISKVEGDKITPSKLLNVFKEETLQTYENKFLNTLIRNLTAFVAIRYDVAKKEGVDEKNTTLTFQQDFEHGRVKGKMKFTLEVAEPADDGVERNYTKTTDIWKRVEKIYGIVRTYANSEFVRNMEGAYVRPPIMKTNALLKNPNLFRCLNLYQFISGYEEAGYSLLVQEDLEKVPESYIREMYTTLAAQYLNFRYHVRNDFDEQAMLETKLTEHPFNPKIVKELRSLIRDEFDVITEEKEPEPQPRFSPEELQLALEISLKAEEIYREQNPEESLAPQVVPEPEPVPEFVEEIPEPEENPDETLTGETETKPEETGTQPEETETKPEEPEEKKELVGESLAAKRRRAENRRRKRFIQHQRNRGVSEEEIQKKLKKRENA